MFIVYSNYMDGFDVIPIGLPSFPPHTCSLIVSIHYTLIKVAMLGV